MAFAQGASKYKPNSVKYKNAGAKPATGRAGSASLEVRALMAKNGSVLVEASTGSLEDGLHPGNIEKAQVKGPGFVKNYNNLSAGGYWSATYPALTRGNTIQVQANIKGIDPKRTGVVTVSAPALLRPDVKVNSIAGPAQSAPNAPVHFTAALSETNGDVGARADCVLSVDGTAVISNPGIWIDAASSVSCAFDYVFTTPGTYTVRASATNVVPGDWDAANNQAETTITILAPGEKIKQGHFQALQLNQLQRYTDSYYYDQTYKHDYSQAYMWGYTQATSDLVQRVDAVLSADGIIAHRVSLTPNPYSIYDYNDGNYFQKCGSYDNWTQTQGPNGWEYTSSGDWMSMCSYGRVNDPSSQASYFNYQRVTGQVTYDSANSGWYSNAHYKYGTGADLGWNAGATIRLKIDFVDAAGKIFDADRSVVLEDRSSDVNRSDWYYTSSGRFYYGFINWQQ
ncbi:MAG: hypothetical protein M3R55_05695 [Acidobacteriota bacterium]|nr:hypothetical protein [Acidobacteriota bacterium]